MCERESSVGHLLLLESLPYSSFVVLSVYDTHSQPTQFFLQKGMLSGDYNRTSFWVISAFQSIVVKADLAVLLPSEP